jgi:hypothetical protein
MSVAGNVLPAANVTYDLGSASMRWKDLYLSGNTLYLGNTVISTSTTTTAGNLTTTDLIIDGSRTVQTVGRTLADSYNSTGYSTNARPDLVQTSVAADAANVVVSTWTTQSSAADNQWYSVVWAPELGIFAAVAQSGTGNRVMTSPDGIHWTPRTSAADNQWRSIAWAPELGLFVAVALSGVGNRVMTSPDGINWTMRASAADNNWNAVCWAPELSLFVVVAFTGTGNRVMTSPDGVTWMSRTSAADYSWMGLTWAPELGIFVAVAETGTGNRVMTSPDGIVWTARTSAADNEWRSITWAPELGIFTAVAETGAGNRVMTSPDGVNWTARTSAADNNWFSVVWAPELGKFVAVAWTGVGNRVMTSPDGITWTAQKSPADYQWLSVCWAPELGIFCSVAYTGTGNRVMTSAPALRTRIAGATSFVGPATTADGDALVSTRDVRVTYPASTVSSGYSSRSPAKSLFRATTVSAVDVVSTWRAQASAADNEWLSVCWAAELGIFVAVAQSGTGNRVMTSPDGINWTARTSAANNDWRSVVWAPELGIFVAVAQTGTGNRVMTSPDGITWTARTSAADNNWHGVVWAAELGIFVAVAYSGTGNRVMTSPDGITWTARNTTGKDNAWRGVTWAPELGIFVAVAYSGTGNRVMTSPDGIEWTLRTSAADNQWLGVTWAPELSLFVAVAYSGTGNRVMTSPNGINWTARTSAADNNWISVVWAPELGIFVAVADSGTGNRVMTSPDGINWTARTSAADNSWFGIAWSPELGIFVAVAYTGTGDRVMTSKSALQIASAGEATFKNTVVVPRLGVGTTAPAYTLDVTGQSMRIQSATGNGSGGRIDFGNLNHGIGRGVNKSTLTDVNDVTVYTDGASGSIGFATSAVERMRITAGGNVGIGLTNPTEKLYVNGNTVSTRYIVPGAGGGAAPGNPYIAAYIDNIGFWNSLGQTLAFIEDDTANSVKLAFTGQHPCQIRNASHAHIKENLVGLIVVADRSEYVCMSGGIARGKDAITINEALPIVSLATSDRDPRAFGVVSAAEDPESRQDAYGSFVTPFPKERGDTRAYINSVGEGAIWVADFGTHLRSGDYITTTAVIPGYGARQGDDVLRAHTVAKITMDCDFDPPIIPKYRIKKRTVSKRIESTRVETREVSETVFDDVAQRYVRKTVAREETVTNTETVPVYDEITGEIIPGETVTIPIMIEQAVDENDLDEDGNLQWEPIPGEFEPAYAIRYLRADGTVITKDEYEASSSSSDPPVAYRAAFVGCTYHCG